MDLEEFKLFLSRHERDLYTFCRHLAISRDPALADDLYQETALKSFELMHKIDASINPKAYIFGIAVGIWKTCGAKPRGGNRWRLPYL